MNIYQAKGGQSSFISELVYQTIIEQYSRYYPKGAVDFFISHHRENNIIGDIEAGYVFYAEDNNQDIVGTITIKNNEICRFFILPKYQKLGYGTNLIQFAEQAISEYADTIILDSSLPAKSMYKKRGYVEISSHSIKTESGDVLCYETMQKDIKSGSSCINYEGKRFTSKVNSDNGEVDNQTIFTYHQNGAVIWADYAGGEIIKGHLLGTSDYDGNLNFNYQHINSKMQIKIGECKSVPIILTNGKLELHEKWQWLNGDESAGESIIVEM